MWTHAPVQPRKGRAAGRAAGVVASAAAIVLRASTSASGPGAFVSAPGRRPLPPSAPLLSPGQDAPGALPAGAQAAGGSQLSDRDATELATVAFLAAAAGGAAGAGRQQADRGSPRTTRHASQQSGGPIDWTGSSTPWQDIQERSFAEVDLWNVHGVLTVSCLTLFAYQLVRICVLRQAPSELEVWFTVAVYLPWTFVTWRDTEQLESHYRVTFYASCGWGVMSLCSLLSVFYEKKYPELAFDVLAVGNAVFALSCLYFYSYHWGRMWRHFTQNRFRPFWIPGLLGLMALHSLTPLDFARRMDDPKWWKTVTAIYPDEWWWVADVRIIELFVTAAALWLIILHIQGVFTGMRNAAVVVIGTIFAPLIIMVLESTWVRASSWQHYLMNGPKYW